MNETCLIVGAGPTGLTLAIELTRFGIPVRLIDKADHAAQWSQALVVQARTLEQFARYGIADDAVARGRKIHRAQMWSDGRQVAEFGFDRIPSRFDYLLFLPQSETEKLLTEHLRSLGVEIERRVEMLGFAQDERGVTAALRGLDGAVTEERFRWLIGCDGAHSVVRRQMGVSFEGETVGLRFSLGDLRLTGEDVPGDEVYVHLHRGGDVLFIAQLTDSTFRVIMALHEQQAEGQPTEQKAPELDEFNAAFERYGLRIRAEASDWSAPFRVNQRKAGTYRAGNVFIAGDASHIHSPVGGQGMNTGIQDAANLAWKMAAVVAGADDSLLDSYNEERGKVGDTLLKGTSRGLAAATASNGLVESLRDAFLHEMAKFGAVQDLMAESVSQTGISYQGSSAVVNAAHGGPLKAGDRMPDAVRADGERLLNDLKQPGHLLIAVDVPAAEVPRDLHGVPVIEVRAQDAWTLPLAGLLGEGPRLFLVRPDGYIGFAGTANNSELRDYARAMALLPRSY